jgi:hypothetical protein
MELMGESLLSVYGCTTFLYLVSCLRWLNLRWFSKYGHRLSASLPSGDDLDQQAEVDESDILHSDDDEDEERSALKKRIALAFLDGDVSEDEFSETY